MAPHSSEAAYSSIDGLGKHITRDVAVKHIVIPARYFVDYRLTECKVAWRDGRPRRANRILKENKVTGLTLLDFKTCVNLQ